MKNLEINCMTRDYLRLKASVFIGDIPLAWDARQRFMQTPGITSFEVSPRTGQVFIGLDRRVLSSLAEGKGALGVLGDYFPELTASARFQQLFRTLH